MVLLTYLYLASKIKFLKRNSYNKFEIIKLIKNRFYHELRKCFFNYRIPLFSDACFNTMSRIFGAWSNIDLTICGVRVMIFDDRNLKKVWFGKIGTLGTAPLLAQYGPADVTIICFNFLFSLSTYRMKIFKIYYPLKISYYK
ncbi:hypothetical protein BpHYR1_049383 [Brachionus plicatilis]|uniref:Uncharacterized protein n=1 Tax=Brachionus plicatilis TaxID=10195 RepID=A0A3M7RDU9_BRAPC|nr:hypothetical protein BpHYR1_049383 [Brachionus plicatilis]